MHFSTRFLERGASERSKGCTFCFSHKTLVKSISHDMGLSINADLSHWSWSASLFFTHPLVFLNPDSANDHRLISAAVMMSCSSHYKDYQEAVAPGETRKRPCLSWAEPVLVISTQPCTWLQWHAKYLAHAHTTREAHLLSPFTQNEPKNTLCAWHACTAIIRQWGTGAVWQLKFEVLEI